MAIAGSGGARQQPGEAKLTGRPSASAPCWRTTGGPRPVLPGARPDRVGTQQRSSDPGVIGVITAVKAQLGSDWPGLVGRGSAVTAGRSSGRLGIAGQGSQGKAWPGLASRGAARLGRYNAVGRGPGEIPVPALFVASKLF